MATFDNFKVVFSSTSIGAVHVLLNVTTPVPLRATLCSMLSRSTSDTTNCDTKWYACCSILDPWIFIERPCRLVGGQRDIQGILLSLSWWYWRSFRKRTNVHKGSRCEFCWPPCTHSILCPLLVQESMQRLVVEPFQAQEQAPRLQVETCDVIPSSGWQCCGVQQYYTVCVVPN